MTLGSLFDGIGGFPLSASKVGIKAVWASEIEPWPIKVTEKHFPGMAHLGDLTKINGTEIPPADIITFGSPCQDLSVAGKRAGLEGQRSGLFMEAVRIIREMREATYGIYPRYAVWENVPGAFSSNKGQDFRAVLEEIGDAEIPMPESGRWATAGMVRTETADIAWRVIDAQYWGVPQRRRRIYLVADFGGHRAAEILFVEQGLRGHSQESGEAGQEATGGAGVGIKDAMCWDGGQISDCLDVSMLSKGQMMPEKRRFPAVLLTQREGCDGGRNAPFIAFNQRDEVIEPQLYDMTHANEVMRLVEPGLAPTLNSRMGTGGNQVPIIMEPMAVHQNQCGEVRLGNMANTLNTNSNPSGRNAPIIAFAAQCVAVRMREGCDDGGKGPLISEGRSLTLGCSNDQTLFTRINSTPDGISGAVSSKGAQGQAVAIQHSIIGRKDEAGAQGPGFRDDGKMFTMDSRGAAHAIATGYAVRRLTPLECLRLQGYPDWWLDIEGMSDTAKYKAIGNSLAIPCSDFVMAGIARVMREESERCR